MNKRQQKESLLGTLDEVFGPAERLPATSPQEVAQFINSPDDEERGCPGHHKLPRCPDNEKICYPSKSSAKSALRIRQRRGAGFLRVYLCDHCHSHHLTSMRFEKS